MTLKAPLLAVNTRPAGSTVGYGATHTLPRDTPVGIVGIGYGDGYPRHAPSGTPVRVRGQRVPLIGRVSMDVLTLDLSAVPTAQVGDEVTLWGKGLLVDEIAAAAGTLGYELLCAVSGRVGWREP